jgi:hypothetical protein
VWKTTKKHILLKEGTYFLGNNKFFRWSIRIVSLLTKGSSLYLLVYSRLQGIINHIDIVSTVSYDQASLGKYTD